MIEKMYKDRFWSYVAISDKNKCWLWTKCLSSRGYGFFGINGKNKLTHRLAYEFTHGEGSATGFVIRHKCDVPTCCNPDHLEKGTNQDNMRDKIERGRARNLKGNECSWAKLTEDQVRDIKHLLKTKNYYHKDIAKMYNVHCVTITDINIGRSWRHV